MIEPANCPKARSFIFASLFTGVYDFNRNEFLQEDNFEIVRKWYESIEALKLNAIIFHNTFSKKTVIKYAHENIQFIEVEYEKRLNPNVFRYFIYQNYIKLHANAIDNLFVTDIADVEVIQNPFESPFYQNNPGNLFCGDEPEILDNEWMRNHSTHLRNQLPAFSTYETSNRHERLLNCGIIGGNIAVMKLLFDKMVKVHEDYSFTNKTAYTLDMGVFNYIARTTFTNTILHGEPVNTVFKQFQHQRTDCWFRHK